MGRSEGNILLATLSAATVLLFGTVILAPLASADPPGGPSGWRTVQSHEVGFQIDLPGEPLYQFSEQWSLLGTVRHHAFVLDLPQARFDVERHDLPALATLALSSRRLLDRARDDLLDDLVAMLHREEDLSLQGYPGRRLLYHRSGVAREEETRMVRAGRHLYIVSAEPYTDVAREEAERVFRTFRICPEEGTDTPTADRSSVTAPATDPPGCAAPGS
jgi:hypothetical protein